MHIRFKKHFLATVILGILFSAPVSAQYTSGIVPFFGTKDYRSWSVGVWGGASSAMHPFGKPHDFNNFSFNNLGLMYGANIKKQLFHSFGLQADFMRGKVKGSQKQDASPLYINNELVDAFETEINWAASLSGVFTLATVNWINKQSVVLPYISVGAGYMSFMPETGSQVKKSAGKKEALYIPLAAGLKFNVSKGVNIDLAYNVNFVNDKEFDGVMGSGRNDKFSVFKLGAEFALGSREKPQLSVVNPAAELALDLYDKNNMLKGELAAAERENQQKLSELQAEVENLKQDTDGDGVPDVHDKCPNTPSGVRVDGSGCPLATPRQIIRQEKIVVSAEDKKVVDEAIRNLEFDLGKSTIRSSSFPSLNRVAEILIEKNFSLKLAGHTDNTGNPSLNMRLSKARAEAVKNYLVAQGANSSRIEATGYGQSQPIASNATEEGRQQNRRVEFTLY